MPIPGRKITVAIDGDPDSAVELSLIEQHTTGEGSGPTFRRRIETFNNSDDSSRQVEIKEITHTQRLPDDDPDDPDQKIKVAVIVRAVTEENSGIMFRRRLYTLTTDNETTSRDTHVKRIRNKDDPDIWLDVRRTDRRVTQEGSGIAFQRRILTNNWDDDADDNAFDLNDLPAEPTPTDPEKVYRTDPYQDIINVNAGVSDILVLTAVQSYSSQDEFDIDPVKFSATTTKRDVFGVLMFPPIEDRDFTQSFKITTDKPTDVPPKPPLLIVDPMSGSMRGRGIAWTRAAAVGSGQISSDESGNAIFSERISTVFINLKKFFKTKDETPDAHGDIIVKIPGFDEEAFEAKIFFSVLSGTPFGPAGDYFSYVDGTDNDIEHFVVRITNLYGAFAIKVLNVTTVSVDDYAGFINADHHLPAGYVRENSTVVPANFYVPASWQLEAYTFRKKKKFPMAGGRVVLTTPAVPPAPPTDTEPEDTDSLGASVVFQGPLAAATVRVRVKFPDLDLELQTI